MDEGGEILDRAIESLRELPSVRPEATARLLIAVAAERQRQREKAPTGVPHRPRWLVWAAVAAAAVVVISVAMGSRLTGENGVALSAGSGITSAGSPALPASNDADAGSSPRPVQLVFSAPRAQRVRVVGDFNGWDDRRSPMARDEVSGLWSVRVMLRPGRHVYAFVVNDTQWVRDPRATPAPDADFGRPGSVLLVGHP